MNIPIRITFDAEKAFAANNVIRPIGPAPKIKTTEPTPTLPRLQACTPTDNGSINAPSTNDTLSGNL